MIDPHDLEAMADMRIQPNDRSSSNPSLSSTAESQGEGSQIAHSQMLVQENPFDLNLEYVRAVRTSSYREFWIKAQILIGKGPEDVENRLLSPNAKLCFFRRVADSLLEPDQEAVDAMLLDSRNWKKLEILELVSDYFDSSQKASSLCGTLLRSIEQARSNSEIIQAALAGLPSSGEIEDDNWQHAVERLCVFLELDNPFSEPAFQQFQIAQDCYEALHKRLEENRKLIDKRLEFVHCCKNVSAGFLIAAVTGISICAFVIAPHALIAIGTAPLLISLPVKSATYCLHSFRQCQVSLLTKHSAQLDAAARGTYTVNRVLDTMIRLVTRLHDEMEQNRVLIRFSWQHRKECYCAQQVVKQFWKNQQNLRQQLEELEEHVYVCFMTINRARSLVIQEVLPRSL